MKKIAIIGAGLAGLMLAKMLSRFVKVDVFEKARGPGGRLTTRYAGDYEFDHGAQFFTVRDRQFQEIVNEWQQEGVVAPWHARFVEISQDVILRTKQWGQNPVHYVGTPRMNSIPKYLAQKLSLHLNKKVVAIDRQTNKSQLVFEGNERSEWYDWVISTAPVEQTLALLPQSVQYRAELEKIKMQGCYSLMLGFDDCLSLEWDAALIKNSLLSWISINSSKPQRSSQTTIVAMTSNRWADAHMESATDWVIQQMRETISQIIRVDLSEPVHIDVQRWRYANAPKLETRRTFIDSEKQIAVCGDWCISGRVESAYIAARELSEGLLPLLG
jgi:predicted NAD/FAD-dependent oxidoreductase